MIGITISTKNSILETYKSKGPSLFQISLPFNLMTNRKFGVLHQSSFHPCQSAYICGNLLLSYSALISFCHIPNRFSPIVPNSGHPGFAMTQKGGSVIAKEPRQGRLRQSQTYNATFFLSPITIICYTLRASVWQSLNLNLNLPVRRSPD